MYGTAKNTALSGARKEKTDRKYQTELRQLVGWWEHLQPASTCLDRNWLFFCERAENDRITCFLAGSIDFVFVWVIEVDLVIVWVSKVVFVLGAGPKWFMGLVWGSIDWIFVWVVDLYLVLV